MHMIVRDTAGRYMVVWPLQVLVPFRVPAFTSGHLCKNDSCQSTAKFEEIRSRTLLTIGYSCTAQTALMLLSEPQP